jgi:C1A family cysteine protease
METAETYPYHEPYDPWDWVCHYDESKVVAHIKGFAYATRDGNETQMQVESAAHGPLSICVATDGWQSYSGGVMKRGCGSDVDHCVQIVGWDSTSQGVPYWIVRNSWAADWGINGYIYIERNEDECQISGEATYVIV